MLIDSDPFRSILALAVALLAGCATEDKSVIWQEEVRLSDGRVIVVNMETLRTLGGLELAHGGSGTRPKERRIKFVHPAGSGQTIEWRSKKTDSGQWPEQPLSLNIVGGNVVVLSVVGTSAACASYSKYVFREGAWIEEPLPEEFAALPTNLLLKSGPDMPKFVDLQAKISSNSDIRYLKRFRQVGPHRKVCDG
jgi:hypothetical protein